MYAWSTSARTTACSDAGSVRAASSAAPIESFAAARADSGTCDAEPTTEWKRAANMLPMTATPSAPPVWRVVSLTAEPTPAFAGGNEPMIDSVAGATVNPIPAPKMALTRTPSTTDDMIVSDVYMNSAAATTSKPP